MSVRLSHEDISSRTSLLNENQTVDDYQYSESYSKKTCKLCLIVGTVIVIIGFGLGFGLYYGLKPEPNECHTCAQESCLGNYCSDSKLGRFEKYAISTDSEPCAGIGKRILEKGGNAVDSMLSVLLCMGVTIPESMGLGGGSLSIIYNSTTGQTEAIDAREEAPAAATADMYNKTAHIYSVEGPLAIAVPGELAGYVYMFKNNGSGRIKWSELFTESIDLCEKGFHVSEHLSTALKQKERIIFEHKDLKDIYVNKKTNEVYKTGEILIQKTLGQTLRRIAGAEDPKKLYYEVISQEIVNDIKSVAKDWKIEPIITVEDFKNYSLKIRKSVQKTFDIKNITIHSFPLPGSGDVLSFILNVMQRYPDLYPFGANSSKASTLFYHRLVETYKFAFSQRMHLGDIDFESGAKEVIEKLRSNEFAEKVKNLINDSRTYDSNSTHYDAQVFLHEDHGTAHATVVDADGNAVSVTTTVNTYFGSKVMSSSTGILLNDEMDDFSTGAPNDFGIPPSNSNYIAPWKRPLSSMSPSVFTDNTGLRLVIGGSGGPKITTAVASVVIRNLWFGEDIKSAIDSQRLHHQLFADQIIYEKCFPKQILCDLEAKGHSVKQLGDGDRGAIIMAISKTNGKLFANSDYRKGGTVDGL